MNTTDYVLTIDNYLENKFFDFHTAVPAKIKSVNYQAGTCSCQPMILQGYDSKRAVSYPELLDVPLCVLGSGNGIARITFPVKAGDLVILLFSERDVSTFFASNGSEPVSPANFSPMGLFPLGAMFNLTTPATAKSVDETKVVIENDNAKVELTPDGTVELKNQQAKVIVRPDGTISLNGGKVTPDGDFVDSSGISLRFHTHTYTDNGVPAQTTPPIQSAFQG